MASRKLIISLLFCSISACFHASSFSDSTSWAKLGLNTYAVQVAVNEYSNDGNTLVFVHRAATIICGDSLYKIVDTTASPSKTRVATNYFCDVDNKQCARHFNVETGATRTAIIECLTF